LADETPSPSRHGTTIVLLVIYGILIVFAFYGSYNFTVWGTADSIKNFASLVTVGVAAVSAIIGTVVSFISLSRNQAAARELEHLKANLQVDVLEKKLWVDLRLESEKAKATAERAAYKDLLGAAETAYFSLAKLEGASWRAGDKAAMDEALSKVQAQPVDLRASAHRDLWDKVRQRARYISEEAGKLTEAKDQPALWKREVASFADLVAKFRTIADEEIHRPAPTKDASAPTTS
jgi:hypothetical protein